MIKVSTIVPAYNIEGYIEKCLESLTNQTIDKFEIIVVNDGSTDNTVSIINDYAKKYPFITVINQENQGVSEAKAAGLKIAQGEYIHFCDGDDYLSSSTAYEELYNEASNNDVDVIMFDNYVYRSYAKKGMLVKTHCKTVIKHKETISTAKRKKPLLKYNFSLCNRLIRRSLIERENISFHKMRSYEDISFYWAVVMSAKSIYYYKKPFYVYVARPNSISRSKTCLKDAVGLYQALDILINMVNSNPTYKKEYLDSLNAFILKFTHDFFRYLKNDKDKEEFFLSIHKYLIDINIIRVKIIPFYKRIKYYRFFKNYQRKLC